MMFPVKAFSKLLLAQLLDFTGVKCAFTLIPNAFPSWHRRYQDIYSYPPFLHFKFYFTVLRKKKVIYVYLFISLVLKFYVISLYKSNDF